jgi:coenzyme F420-0:L-glutamate ligase/coenzyme F420-1:gamma-L-glutamate ligase
MPVLTAIPIQGIGEIRPGDSLAEIILAACGTRAPACAPGVQFLPGDILVITHKIVSKAEGRIVPLDSVRPPAATRRWAAAHNLDARVLELGLQEAARIVRKRRGVLITETAQGFVCANSGVDASNVDGGSSAVLLPRDPDASARRVCRALKSRLGFEVPVIITDTFGRPWREGLTEVAIGLAGMSAFRDFRGRRDPHGYKLRVSVEAVADELACVAGLACGKLAREPACIVRGFPYNAGQGRARDLIRAAERDLFR